MLRSCLVASIPSRRQPLIAFLINNSIIMTTTHYRRIDTTDPRRHDRIRPLSFPAQWNDDGVDVYGFFLSSATMLSGAAMVTRLPTLAFVGLIFAIANFVHDKPHQAKKDSAQSATGGPVMGLSCVAGSRLRVRQARKD